MLAIFLLGCLTFFESCKPKNCCCDLPAPENLTVNMTPPGTANFEWSPVTSASRYRVTVRNETTDTLFLKDTVVDNSILVPGLTPGHDYVFIVQAMCGEDKRCQISPNANATCRTMIIEDMVVMREVDGTGMDTCACEGPETQVIGNPITLSPSFSSGSTRVIYRFKIGTPSGSYAYFKLAYDVNCIHSIKAHDCSHDGVSLLEVPKLNAPDDIEFREGNNKFLTLTPKSDGTVGISWNGPTYSIGYMQCSGSWLGPCTS